MSIALYTFKGSVKTLLGALCPQRLGSLMISPYCWNLSLEDPYSPHQPLLQMPNIYGHLRGVGIICISLLVLL